MRHFQEISERFQKLKNGFDNRVRIAEERKEKARLETIQRQLQLTKDEIIAIVEEDRQAQRYPGKKGLLQKVEERMLHYDIQWSEVRKVAKNELAKILRLTADQVVAIIGEESGQKLSGESQFNLNLVKARAYLDGISWDNVVATAVASVSNP